MNNVLGQKLKLILFGESHSEYIGGTIDGLSPGIKIDYDYIDLCLEKRRPIKALDTNRREKDDYKIISGVFNGYTTGDPLTLIIKNEDVKSEDYEKNKSIARPSHADYTRFIKSQGFNDYRGGGASSARLTSVIVALGSIVLKALENKGIMIESHIKSVGNVRDDYFDSDYINDQIKTLRAKSFPTISDIEREIRDEIASYKENNDSIGGIVETAIVGLDAGYGEPWFNTFEGAISNAIFSVPAVKGIEFGLGFGFKNKVGSLANDEFYLKDNKVKTRSNNNGGINGGITNGMPVIFRSVIKATPSISKPQKTIDFNNLKESTIKITGRHDPSIVRRAVIVLSAISAFVVADFYLIRNGEDALKE